MILGMALVTGLVFPLQAQTSEDNPRLQKALERFPAADADKDGILTLAEAKAFRDKRGGQDERRGARGAGVPKGGEKHIYKKVGEVELPLYVYEPAGHKAEANAPAIVFFFGGGWKSGTPTQFEHHCKDLAKRGMVAITVEYRVSSRHPVKVEDCVEDAKSAMRWVRAHAAELGVDPDRIASGGGSAGGHLAACTALIDDLNAESDDLEVSAKPNAMVLFNPAMGWADREEPETNRTKGPLKKVMPLTYASEKQPPCIMFFGTADGLLKGAEAFLDESKKAGNDCKIVTYEGQGHGFFNHGKSGGKYYALTMSETDKFLADLGWLSGE
jgi:acetyl esterase/lipase